MTNDKPPLHCPRSGHRTSGLLPPRAPRAVVGATQYGGGSGDLGVDGEIRASCGATGVGAMSRLRHDWVRGLRRLGFPRNPRFPKSETVRAISVLGLIGPGLMDH
ncbi:hypothetical protein EPI10_021619 [Gossypium australe]|uniref:Uncharacterized protein n=1 Tax=Gossypium australe TaxID=47621 RepID=A0A5B6WK83_9ROSI|nr:hypothetical protein EPI10_021619 [Gossypium australe]